MAHPLRLLLIEDQEDDATLLLRELRRGEWDLTHRRVETAADMLAALEAGGWDIIISDYSLPAFSGLAALEIARKRASELPFILVSGTVGEEVAVEAMRGGANDYLFKGNLTRLRPAVQRELRDAAMRREARRVHQQLRDRDRQLAEARRLAHLGGWVLDLRADATVWSDETYEILGHPARNGPLTCDAFISRLHPDDQKHFTSALDAPDVKRFAHDYRVVLPGQSVRFVHVRGDIVRDEAGKAVEAAGMIQDITERKLAEEAMRTARDELAVAKEAAEAANRAKDQFLAALSHELRTPLTPVLLTVALLERGGQLSDESLEDLKSVRHHVELEARLIDDLLDLTRISQDKLPLNVETTEAHVLLRSAVEHCCAERMDDVTLALEADRYYVRADPARLKQVYWNLLSNADKFTPPGRPITVRSSNPDPHTLRVEVIDGGRGIDPSVLPRVFNAFEQGSPRLTNDFGGLGLGLTIAKAIVDGHGGRIAAESDGRDKGARCTVDMPTVATPRSRPA